MTVYELRRSFMTLANINCCFITRPWRGVAAWAVMNYPYSGSKSWQHSAEYEQSIWPTIRSGSNSNRIFGTALIKSNQKINLRRNYKLQHVIYVDRQHTAQKNHTIQSMLTAEGLTPFAIASSETSLVCRSLSASDTASVRQQPEANCFFRNMLDPQQQSRPSEMIAMRSPNMSASSMKCVDRIMVRPVKQRNINHKYAKKSQMTAYHAYAGQHSMQN